MPVDQHHVSEEEPEAAGLRELLSGEPLFSFDGELRIVAWYRAAEELTGTGAEEALGRHCWEVLDGVGEDGTIVCRRDCSLVELARERGSVPCLELRVTTPDGPRRASLSTIRIRGGERPIFLHLLRDPPERVADEPAPPRPATQPGTPLSGRQRQVLELLAEGVRAQEIAARLGLSETTVRNHIRALLFRLGCHSQLEAVAKARRLRIIGQAAGER